MPTGTTRLYRKKGLIHAYPYEPWVGMENVTINQKDVDAGSPKEGDMIAYDPNNPSDSWLISEAYFKANYESVD